jgi:hypothetical protein
LATTIDPSNPEDPAAPSGARSERLIPVDTEHGRRLLREAVTVDYESLVVHYEGQMLQNFCSIATGVVALNALLGRTHHSQFEFFTSHVTAICDRERVEEDGMTLAELGAALGSHGAQVTVHHAEDDGVGRFREIAARNLNTHGDFLIVNYLREALGQRSGGHFSPLAAFHPVTDRFLILDVADVRYPPVWVDTEVLFRAMATVDVHSGRRRGFIAVAM